jgi:hypothetical protein
MYRYTVAISDIFPSILHSELYIGRFILILHWTLPKLYSVYTTLGELVVLISSCCLLPCCRYHTDIFIYSKISIDSWDQIWVC